MEGTSGSIRRRDQIPFGAGGRDKMHSSVYRWVAWVGLCVLMAASATRAESVLNFQPTPISAGNPEFIYTGGATGELVAGPGAWAMETGRCRLLRRPPAGYSSARRLSFPMR